MGGCNFMYLWLYNSLGGKRLRYKSLHFSLAVITLMKISDSLVANFRLSFYLLMLKSYSLKS